MTPTTLLPAATATSDAPRRTWRARRALRTLAIAACLPYIALKIAWVAGSHIGIPDGSSLLDHRATMVVANSVTILMDAAVVALALLLTRPWGLRVPAWLLGLPMWAASGLLAPIMTGYPLQLLVKAAGGTVNKPADTGRRAFLDDWVFGVVYTGFILQGLALGTLFVLYARDRWGHLWRGRVRDLPGSATGHTQRTLAVAAAVVALFPVVTHLMWACDSRWGLSESRSGGLTSDAHVLEAMYAVFLLAAAAGGLLLAFRAGRTLPVKVPLALAWVGSGAAACWGGWLGLAAVSGVSEQPTPVMNLTYAGHMIVGILVAAIGVRHFRERANAA
ncbi:hypothetical protein ACQB60_00540 [Actinomycetota bacterium Odt1-20B]